MPLISELKRRLKAEKKAAEKEAKIKEQPEQDACKDEETLDPTVSFIFLWSYTLGLNNKPDNFND